MIVATAICPGAPLLIPELTGGALVEDGLRSACLKAVRELSAARPDAIVVVGVAQRTATWPRHGELDTGAFAPGPARARRSRAWSATKAGPDLPTSLGVGRWLLTAAGYHGGQVLQAVAVGEPAGRCMSLGASLAAAPGRRGLLVVADGTAKRTLKAPGYFDARSARFDGTIERAILTGRLNALADVDPGLAGELMATGRPAWQVLAGALAGRKVTTEIRYRGDPFGVAYLVASLRLEGGGDG